MNKKPSCASGGGQRVGAEKGSPLKKTAVIALRSFLVLVGAALVFESAVAYSARSFNLGIIMPFVIGLPLLTLGIFYSPICRLIQSLGVFGKLIKYGFIGAYALFILLFAATTTAILLASRAEEAADADAVIVLGAAIRGTEPTVQLSYRLDAAAEFYRAHPEIVLVVSGGRGADEIVSEAEVMRRSLVALGVPSEKILLEDRATSTEENFLFSKQLIDEYFLQNGDDDVARIAFVTNRFHVFRSERLSERLGISAQGIPAREFAPFILNDYMRECAAIVQHFFTGRL